MQHQATYSLRLCLLLTLGNHAYVTVKTDTMTFVVYFRYDPEGQGYIDHQHFLIMMGKTFAPGDNKGFSTRVVEDSCNTISAHHKNQLQKQ